MERVKGMRFVAKEVRDEARLRQYFSTPLLTASSPFLITSMINHLQMVTALVVELQSGSPETGIQGPSLSRKAEFLFVLAN